MSLMKEMASLQYLDGTDNFTSKSWVFSINRNWVLNQRVWNFQKPFIVAWRQYA
jgi:hypothetical protein